MDAMDDTQVWLQMMRFLIRVATHKKDRMVKLWSYLSEYSILFLGGAINDM